MGKTALHNAAWGKDRKRGTIGLANSGKDSPDCVKMLLSHGVNVMARDKKGNTAIHTASNTNAPESLKLLLEHGGDPNYQNMFNRAPLHKSCKHGTIDCANILLQYGTSFFRADHSEKKNPQELSWI